MELMYNLSESVSPFLAFLFRSHLILRVKTNVFWSVASAPSTCTPFMIVKGDMREGKHGHTLFPLEFPRICGNGNKTETRTEHFVVNHRCIIPQIYSFDSHSWNLRKTRNDQAQLSESKGGCNDLWTNFGHQNTSESVCDARVDAHYIEFDGHLRQPLHFDRQVLSRTHICELTVI